MTEPSYAKRRIASGLDKYSLQLSGLLRAEASKPRKQRRSLYGFSHLHLTSLFFPLPIALNHSLTTTVDWQCPFAS
jgi:hypothetical protein